MRRIALLLFLCLPLPAAGQSAASSPPESVVKRRAIVVTLTDGSVINATNIHIENERVKITSTLGESALDLERVKKIEFQSTAEAERNDSPQPPEIRATKTAIETLRSLAVAARAGLPFVEYKTRVADATAKVEEAERLLPEGELKSLIRKSVLKLTYARFSWEISLRSGHQTTRQLEELYDAWRSAADHANAAEKELLKIKAK